MKAAEPMKGLQEKVTDARLCPACLAHPGGGWYCRGLANPECQLLKQPAEKESAS